MSPGESTLPAGIALTRGILDGLQGDSGSRFEIYTEFLDLLRLPSADLGARINRMLQEKYASIAFDLIIPIGRTAFDFVRTHRDTLRLTAPVVAAMTMDEGAALSDAPPFAAGVYMRTYVTRTVELALRLQPSARNLVVVAGVAPIDRSLERGARERLRAFADRLSIRYLVGLPLGELLAEVGRLPPATIVLYLSVLQDGTGRRFESRDLARQVAAAATAPVYGIYDTYLGVGLVGGYLDRFHDFGVQVATVALSVLGGEDPARIGIRESVTHANLVDWRALRRWGLDEANLPPGAVIRFREPSVWETHRPQILAGTGFLALQSLLLVALLVERQRRRRIATSLRKREEQVAVAAMSADLGLWDWNLATGNLWASDHCRALLGLGVDEALSGRSLLGTIHPDDRAGIRRAIDGAAATGATFEAEFRLAQAGERAHWLRVTGRARRDGPRTAPLMTGVVIDITARKESEREAEQQRQQLVHLTRVAALGETSGALAHELNQPLTAIVSNAEAAQKLLAHERIDLAMVREIVDDIASEGGRAGAIIQRTRSLLRRSEPHRETVDVNRLVLEVVNLLRSELIERQVSPKIQPARVLPRVRGDPVQLEQVLINLIVNACEAMSRIERDARLVIVSTGIADDGFVSIAVTDRGPGIRTEVQQQLFTPFFTTKKENLGLGLAICRWIVAEHGGRLDGGNNADRGATFTIALPTVAEARLAS